MRNTPIPSKTLQTLLYESSPTVQYSTLLYYNTGQFSRSVTHNCQSLCFCCCTVGWLCDR